MSRGGAGAGAGDLGGERLTGLGGVGRRVGGWGTICGNFEMDGPQISKWCGKRGEEGKKYKNRVK